MSYKLFSLLDYSVIQISLTFGEGDENKNRYLVSTPFFYKTIYQGQGFEMGSALS